MIIGISYNSNKLSANIFRLHARLQQIPKELTGKYQSYDWKKINGIMKRDSNEGVTVKNSSIIIHTKRAETYNLCDTFTFSKYKDYYFVSERAARILDLLQFTKNTNRTYRNTCGADR